MSDLVHSLESLPPGPLYALIATFAALENIFPPVPADTVVALGAFLAGRGTLDPWAVFGLTWTANVGSGAAVYFASHRFGRPFFQGTLGRRLLSERTLALASALWYGLLTYLVSVLGTNLDAVLRVVARVNGALAVVALAAVLGLGLWIRRRLRR